MNNAPIPISERYVRVSLNLPPDKAEGILTEIQTLADQLLQTKPEIGIHVDGMARLLDKAITRYEERRTEEGEFEI